MLGQEGRGEDEDLSLERAAQRHVRRVLRLVGGDEAAAAKRLGITKKSLKEHLTSD
jgi:ActR/RegA family two-component response regulator